MLEEDEIKCKVFITLQQEKELSTTHSQVELGSKLKTLLKLFQKGNLEKSERQASIIIKKYPKNQFSWNILGLTLGKLGKINEALIAHKKAVMLSINDPDSYINLGNTYKELGNLKGAEKNYRVVIDLKPDYAQAFSNLGNILYDLGKCTYNFFLQFYEHLRVFQLF